MASYDLLKGSRVAVLHSICYQIVFESSRIARFIMNVEKQEDRLTTGNICIYWVVHDLENKVIAPQPKVTNFPLASIVEQALKVRYAENQASVIKS